MTLLNHHTASKAGPSDERLAIELRETNQLFVAYDHSLHVT